METNGNLTNGAARIMPALRLLLGYLEEAIAATEARFREDGHEPSDDSPAFSGMVRLHVRTKMGKHLPLSTKAPMSPVHLSLGPDQVRMLHAQEGRLPYPRTKARRMFYSVNDFGIMALNVTPPDGLVEVEESETEVQDGSFVLVWDSSGPDLVLADLYLTSLKDWPGEKLDLLAETVEETEEDITGIEKIAESEKGEEGTASGGDSER